MKKVLILTYYWPPAGGAGVQRWLKFVKYLSPYGWTPVVYTAENGEMPVIDQSLEKDIPPGITVLRTPIWEPYSVYKRFIGRRPEDKINASFLSENKKGGLAEKISVWIRGNFFIPDARRFWIRPSIKYLTRIIEKENIGIVISSGPPHSMHLIARGLKKKHPRLKWVADFRDPWTNIDYYSKLMLTPFADKKHRTLEKRVLHEADIVISVGKQMSDEFRGIYQNSGGKDPGKFREITNGFDDDDLTQNAKPETGKFILAHIGTLVRDRNAPVLWRVLSRMIKSDISFASRFELQLIGKVDIHVKEDLGKHGLLDHVKLIPYLPHNEVIKAQQQSSVLLLLVNNTANAKGILTGKAFEYLASGRPILAIGPEDGELAEILHETKAGFINGFDSEAKLEEKIQSLFNGEFPPRNEDAIKRYSRRELTAKLANILNEL